MVLRVLDQSSSRISRSPCSQRRFGVCKSCGNLYRYQHERTFRWRYFFDVLCCWHHHRLRGRSRLEEECCWCTWCSHQWFSPISYIFRYVMTWCFHLNQYGQLHQMDLYLWHDLCKLSWGCHSISSVGLVRRFSRSFRILGRRVYLHWFWFSVPSGWWKSFHWIFLSLT